MQLRRLLSVGSVVVLATGAALAQPKQADKKKTPAPATGSAAGSAGAPAGSAAPAEGSAVQPIEDAPPSDMEGRDENPDAPRGTQVKVESPTAPVEAKPSGYPIELALRPITLPANMAEVSIDPHFRVSSPAELTSALRARYGITPKIQLGLTYVFGGVYNDPATTTKDYKFHPGKAGGLDVTVLVTNWFAVRAGLPVYLDPFAMSLALGAPMKFHLTDQFAIGGMDDLLNIALPFGAEFAPSFYSEGFNAAAAERDNTGSTQSRGSLRLSGFAIYQQKPNMAIIGRLAIEFEDFATNRGDTGFGGATTSIHGGVSFTPKKFLDVGGTLGFDDLSELPESFTLSGFLAVRI
jgi:hypothetical protein